MDSITIRTVILPNRSILLQDLPLAPGEVWNVTLTPTAAPVEAGKEGELYPLRGTPYHYADPFEPACPPEDWEESL